MLSSDIVISISLIRSPPKWFE